MKKMFPVRCYTCNALLGHLAPHFATSDIKWVMDTHNINRICCRRMAISHVDIVDDLLIYPHKNEVVDQSNTTFNCKVDLVRTVDCD